MKITIEQNTLEINVETGPLTKVTLFDGYYGLTARGYAKCVPEDKYDEKFGIELALARATARLSAKRIKELIRETGLVNGAA